MTTVTPSGLGAASALGTVGIGAQVVLSGLGASGAVGGTTISSVSQPSGLGTSGALGTVGLSASLALVGQSGTAALGTATVTTNNTSTVSVGGLEGASGLGAVGLSATVNLTGIAASSAMGSAAVRVDATVGGVGVAGASALGTVTLSALKIVEGVTGTSALGTVVLSATEAPAGLSQSTALGTVTLSSSVAVSGLAAASALGTAGLKEVLLSPTLAGLASGVGTVKVKAAVVGSAVPTAERWVSPKLPAGDQLLGVLQGSLDRLERTQGRTPVVTADRRITSAITVVDSDGVVLVDCTAGNVAVTLPAASAAIRGRSWAIKKMDGTANTVTITAAGSDTIDGAATYAFNTQYAVVWVQCAVVTPPATYGWVVL